MHVARRTCGFQVFVSSFDAMSSGGPESNLHTSGATLLCSAESRLQRSTQCGVSALVCRLCALKHCDRAGPSVWGARPHTQEDPELVTCYTHVCRCDYALHTFESPTVTRQVCLLALSHVNKRVSACSEFQNPWSFTPPPHVSTYFQ